MSPYRRYAVYYSPPPGPFADFGAAWLGWDVATGREVAQPAISGLDLPALTAAPRRYGFHATLKAPFRLAASMGPAELAAAVATLAARTAPVVLPCLDLVRLGSFLALVPKQNDLPLAEFGAAIVTGLDPLRAPLTEAERARRYPDRLTARQREYLDRWGYPFVLEEFRFHMTLSGPLTDVDLDRVAAALEPRLRVVPKPLPIEDICLMGEDEAGHFHLIERFALQARAPVHEGVTGSVC